MGSKWTDLLRGGLERAGPEATAGAGLLALPPHQASLLQGYSDTRDRQFTRPGRDLGSMFCIE